MINYPCKISIQLHVNIVGRIECGVWDDKINLPVHLLFVLHSHIINNFSLYWDRNISHICMDIIWKTAKGVQFGFNVRAL